MINEKEVLEKLEGLSSKLNLIFYREKYKHVNTDEQLYLLVYYTNFVEKSFNKFGNSLNLREQNKTRFLNENKIVVLQKIKKAPFNFR